MFSDITSLLAHKYMFETYLKTIYLFRLLYPPLTKFRGVYRNHSVHLCPSVRLSICPSVCADSCPAHNFFCFGLPYLVHGCITMRQCLAHIHDPNTALTSDLKIKFTGFLTCFRVWPITNL